MKLSIVIVNYKSGPLTKSCVESILEQDLPFKYEIIVIDNNSDDDSVHLLRSDFPEIKVVENNENVGLAAAVNKGIKLSRGEYYLNLNPDITVLPKALENMVMYMDDNQNVGIAGGKLISANGRLQFSCFRFYKMMTIVFRRTRLSKTRQGKEEVARFLMKDFDHMTEKDVDWLLGACLLVRDKAVREVGGMDERFFLYFEDVDWCRRFWEKGWRVTYLPQSIFSHYYQRSSEGGLLNLLFNRVPREHLKSAFKYFYKYRGKSLPSHS